MASATPSANAIPKADSGGDLDAWISAASTSTPGIVALNTSGGTDATKAVVGNDARLSDSRTPAAHASSHVPGASDSLDLPPAQRVTFYGLGRDGALNFDGSTAVTINGVSHSPSGGVYTLQHDVVASSITTATGVTIAASGFHIWCNGTWTSNGTVVVHDDGNNASGATAGTFLSVNFNPVARSAPAGGNGASGLNNGSNATGIVTTGCGGIGGTGGNSPSRTGGTGGQCSTSQYSRSIHQPLAHISGYGTRNNSGTQENKGFECGSGGGGGASETGGTGGGGGSGGGFLLVHCYNINVQSGSLTFRAKGGNGGNASGNAGGGGGGGGGVVILHTHTYTGSVSVSAAGGTKGNKAGTGSDATDGNAGHTLITGNGSYTFT